jgi:hypothetical protein
LFDERHGTPGFGVSQCYLCHVNIGMGSVALPCGGTGLSMRRMTLKASVGANYEKCTS